MDTTDYETFAPCSSGPMIPHDGTATCAAADFDDDGDVDGDDFGVFQRCYSGAGYPADPACAV